MLPLLLTLTVVLLLLAAALLWMGGKRGQSGEIDWAARVAGDTRSLDPTISPVTSLVSSQNWFHRSLLRAGLEPSAPSVRRGLFFVVGIVLLAILALGLLLGLVIFLVLLFSLWLWILNKEAKRKARILEQLPDFVEHMVRALSAGNSLEESLYSATADAENPIRELFLSVGRQVRLGAPIEDVLDQAAADHDITDIRVIAMAARVNRRYGGSLKRIFKSLVQAIRERDAAARELRALTAETRFSAMVLGIVPIVLSLYILLQNPDYYVDMWNESQGRSLLLLSVFLQASGVAVIWRMLRTAERGA
ncbi:MAG: type II secretion system F family protein [Oceanococcus sp.]